MTARLRIALLPMPAVGTFPGRAARGSVAPRKMACRSAAGSKHLSVQGHRRALKGQSHGCSFAQEHTAPAAVQNCPGVDILRSVHGTSQPKNPGRLAGGRGSWCVGWDDYPTRHRCQPTVSARSKKKPRGEAGPDLLAKRPNRPTAADLGREDQDGAGSTDFGLVTQTASTHAIHKNRK